MTTKMDPEEYKKLLQRVDQYGKGLTEWESNRRCGRDTVPDLAEDGTG
jgi:hypothetical protein